MSEKENINSSEEILYNNLKALTDDLCRIRDYLNEFPKDGFKETVKDTLRDFDKSCEETKKIVSNCVKKHPVETIITATAIGLLIGALVADKK